MEIFNREFILINQSFKMMGIEEIISDFYKPSPYTLNSRYHDYAPCNLELEEACPYGNYCFDKRNPRECYRNHQTSRLIIPVYSLIPSILCRYERPWKKLSNGEKMRCQNKYCWFSHLKGRKEILEKLFNKS